MLESIKKPDGINIPEIKIVFRVPANYNAQEIQKNPDNILKEIRIFRKEKGIGKKVEQFYKVDENTNQINLIDTPLLVDEILQIKIKLN